MTAPSTPDVDALVQVLWDYMLVGHELHPVDCIFVLCSHDIRVADYAIRLFKTCYAPYLIFSGGVIQQNAALNVYWDTTEAEYFARRAVAAGIASDHVLIEDRSTNTGENFVFTRQLLEERAHTFQSFVMVQKPYMERRVLATALKLWPDADFIVTSPPISCADYLKGQLPRDAVIQHIVGDFQRIRVYGDKGFQAPQAIPMEVWNAFEELCALGYHQRLVH